MRDILRAKDGYEGVTWDFRKVRGKQLTTYPLPCLFKEEDWEMLNSLNAELQKEFTMASYL